jgi:lipid A ethanolaminephosphotransferase
LRVETLVLAVVAWVVATANFAWWGAVGEGRDWSQPSNWIFLLCCFTALVALHFALVAPFAIRWVVRPLLTALVVISAAAAWYMRNYAVLLDPTMIQNVLRTDTHEARELLNLDMLAWVIAWSALPVAFIWMVKLRPVAPLRALLVRAGAVLAACVVAALAFVVISRDLTSFMRNDREARYLITPGNFIYGLAVQSAHRVEDVHVAREPVGTDAHSCAPRTRSRRACWCWWWARRPRGQLLAAGLSARNQSRAGAARTSRLSADVTSCGTSTEVSVPCMFSPYGRANYDERRIRNSEACSNVLVRAGYTVKWLDNQSGCKGVCKGDGIDYEKLVHWRRCAATRTWRGAWLEELPQVATNTVFVLHMMGNHGPAYFKRYPAQFRRFLPDCATAELRDCSREQVVNAYDNAILYTEHVLAA